MSDVLSKWQRPDGFPTDDYFAAVTQAITGRGIPIDDQYRNEDWEFGIELAPAAQQGGPLAAWALIFVGWSCSEEDAPTHADDFTEIGWYWVPHRRYGALGAWAEELGLPQLAEPADVAAAVGRLLATGTPRQIGLAR